MKRPIYLSLAFALLAGCGSPKPKPAPAPRVNLSQVVTPSPTPTAPPVSPLDIYVQKRRDLQVRDKAIGDELQKVIVDLNQGLSGPDKAGALKRAAEAFSPVVAEAKAVSRDYGRLDNPGEVRHFQEASATAEKSLADGLESLQVAMASGDESAFAQALDDLRSTAAEAARQIDEALTKDGFDPRIWDRELRLVKAAESVRTGL